MTIKEKINLLEELLDVEKDALNEGTNLEEIEQWDSMAVIVLIAMFDESYGKSVSPKKIKGFKIVKDIIDEME